MVARRSLNLFGEDASSIFYGFQGVKSSGKWFPAALKFADNRRVDLAAIDTFTGSTDFARLSPLKSTHSSAICKTKRLHSFERVDRCLRVIQVSDLEI